LACRPQRPGWLSLLRDGAELSCQPARPPDHARGVTHPRCFPHMLRAGVHSHAMTTCPPALALVSIYYLHARHETVCVPCSHARATACVGLWKRVMPRQASSEPPPPTPWPITSKPSHAPPGPLTSIHSYVVQAHFEGAWSHTLEDGGPGLHDLSRGHAGTQAHTRPRQPHSQPPAPEGWCRHAALAAQIPGAGAARSAAVAAGAACPGRHLIPACDAPRTGVHRLHVVALAPHLLHSLQGIRWEGKGRCVAAACGGCVAGSCSSSSSSSCAPAAAGQLSETQHCGRAWGPVLGAPTFMLPEVKAS
jgi:hypothetical protein